MDQAQVVLVVQIALVAALGIALATVVYRFLSFCLADLDEATAVQYLSRDAWRLLILLWIPVGGMLYLRYGRVR
jgi:hypothetical protein